MPPMHLKLCFSMASTALEELCRVSLKVNLDLSKPRWNMYPEELRVFQR